MYYSGITVLLGDRFNPSNVHRIRIGDILKLGSVSMLVTRLDAGGGEEGIVGVASKGGLRGGGGKGGY